MFLYSWFPLHTQTRIYVPQNIPLPLYISQIFQHVLNELVPVCLAEQDFCVHFFQLAAENKDQVDQI